MNEIFTKILMILISIITSVWVSISAIEWRLSDHKDVTPVPSLVSVTNYVTLTNYVVATNFVSIPVSTNEVVETVLSPGIPFIVNTQSVTVISIDPPTEKTNRLRQISEELKTILEDLKEKEKK